MGWNDKKLRSEETEYCTAMDSDSAGRRKFLKPLDYLTHFCDRCPHMKMNTKLFALIQLLNVANPITPDMKADIEEKIRSYL